MEQQRTLTVGAVGMDVALLHRTLLAVGIEIGEAELDAREFGETTSAAVSRLQRLLGLEPTGVVDQATFELAKTTLDRLEGGVLLAGATVSALELDEAVVEGTVSDVEGLPLPRATVSVQQRLIREAHEVGRGQTDELGRYRVLYQRDGGNGAGKSNGQGPDLQLEVLDERGDVLFTSPTYFHVAPRVEIPLAIGGEARSAPPEHVDVDRTLTRRLGRLRPEELVENQRFKDLSFLAGDTGIAKPTIALYSVAARIAGETEVPAELFYALFREGVPADASVAALAGTSKGVDLDANSRRLLESVLAASPAVRARAVESALERNILGARYAERADEDLARLEALSVDAALASSNTMGKTPIRDVLSAAEIPAERQRRFITLLSASTGSPRKFWADLATDPDFTPRDVADLRFAMDVGRFTRGHMPLIEHLLEQRGSGTIRGTRDLARMTAEDWKTLIVRRRIGVPANFTAQDPEQALDAYAYLLERRFERRHPTTAFSARLAVDPATPFESSRATVEFLDGNPQFSLLRTNVDRYLYDRGDALPGEERTAVRETLLISQRLLKLTSRYAVAKPLLEDGIHSAQQVYAMGRVPFIEAYEQHADIGAAQAARVHAVSEQTYALALNLAMNVNASLSGLSPAAVIAPAPADAPDAGPAPGPTPAEVDVFPNLQTLFGAGDLCTCKHCRSVLSPAAYMTDLLRFVSRRKTGAKTAKDVLLARRPDLVHIELSCANTNTVMPYVDLVNELLEDAVAPPSDPVAAMRARQTTGTTPELNANPEHVNAAAYTKLAQGVYPWSLPFDLPLLEARAYLAHLGTNRVALMRAFRPPPAIPSAGAVAEAVEALGLSAMEADIITGGPLASGHQPWDFWGLAQSGNNIADPVDRTTTISGTWLEVLAHVRVLLHRSGLSYDALAQLLNTEFVNPGGTVALVADPPDSCDLATTTVTGLTADVLARLHRFVRLMRRLGWTPYELDAAVNLLQGGTAAGIGRLNTGLLRQLHAVEAAMSRLRIPAAAAIALFARIDTREVPLLPGEDEQRHALYHRLFQDRTVVSPVDPIFTLDASGTEIAGIGGHPKLADHRAALMAAFEVSDPDLLRAIAAFTDGELTVANLSALYRNILLARGLELTIEELIALRRLVEREIGVAPGWEAVDPFDGARPELLGIFLDAVDRLRSTRFSVAQVDYLLRHVYDATSGVAPDDVAVGTLLKAIRDGLVKIAAENAAGPDATGTVVRRALATVLEAADVEALMGILAGTTTLAAAAQDALIAAKLGTLLNVADAQAKLVGAAALAPGAPRNEYLLGQLLASFRRTLGTRHVVQQLADALVLPIATVADLVAWLPAQGDPLKPLIDELLALAAVARDPAKEGEPIARDEAGFDVYFRGYTALDSAAQLIAGLGFTRDDVAWLRDVGIGLGWLDPATLPLAPTAGAQGRFARWTRLADAATVRERLPSDGTPFTALMDLARGGADKATYLTALRARTQWTAEGLRVLAGDPANVADQGLLGLTFPDDYRSERALTRLMRAFALLRRHGITADVSGWIGATVSAAQADAIKQSVKAKYSSDRWPGVAKPLRDGLREQQRDALVAYLLANPPSGVTRWFDSADVYAHYLIDVEMAACQATSRIVQANATIQLFVQRALLNLEREVKADAGADPDWLQWRWMSRYRVWEANRNVFLYPEKWIEPPLRRDKSPFFRELEQELLQAEVTKDTAEEAFRKYLEKLDAVARLDVVGMYHEAGSPNVLHVIGRKQGDTPTYYYRQWIDASRWTAWSKIDLDIVSDHVVPIVWNRRLYLFWAITASKPNRSQTQPPLNLTGAQPPETAMHLEIQLAWSEYKGGKWLARQTAPQTLVVPWKTDAFEVTLKSAIADPLLRIDVFVSNSDYWREHWGEFVLGGVGNGVEVFALSQSALYLVGTETRGIGTLPGLLNRGTLSRPTDSDYDGMAIGPDRWRAGTALSAARPRVFACNSSYDYYGTLASEVVLKQADRYRMLIPHQNLNFDSSLPFFFTDSRRSYFLIPTIYYQSGNYFSTTAPPYVYHPFYKAAYAFQPFYHAFVPLFIRELNSGGVDALFAKRLQLDPAGVQGVPAFDFGAYYAPTDNVVAPYPTEGIDFDPHAGYSIYNWELFFHAPFQIAESLRRNQRFAEAKDWYEYVFDPTSTTAEDAPQRFWVTKPFHAMTAADYRAQLIQNVMKRVNARDPQAEHQVAQWRANPFDPHIIAGLRPVAYQRAIVMRYIDNLIAWGDQLFRQDTMESVNEATQLYVLAAELLGPRPQFVPPPDDGAPRTYAELEPDLDTFSNAVAAAENTLAPVEVNVEVEPSTPKLPLLPPLYFRVPPNEEILGYWSTVGDRLFKIRHCMNIQGVTRQLALFAPPIDPALLVRAAAAGLDLGSILDDTSAALPPYRFRVLLREAMELAQSVRALGGDLLTCLERRDAAALELLRSAAERKVQVKMKDVHEDAVKEAGKQLDVLAKNRLVVEERQKYFDTHKDDTANPWETAAMVAGGAAVVVEGIAAVLHTTSAAAHAFPDAQFGASGAGGSPHVTAKYGGPNVGRAADGGGKAARLGAAILQAIAQMSQVMGTYERRKEEWQLQYDLARLELDQLDEAKLALTLRQDLVTKERDNHHTVAKAAEDVDEYLHDRFTNQELYDWMVGQTSATYFQSYQLAYSVAKRAERCYRRELGVADSSFIEFGYWDSLKKGLLAGDKLMHDLQRMEASYLAENVRELEITQKASLLAIDPYALVELRTTGECTVRLPELWFDLENPRHYHRRLKAVGVTAPCVAGPNTNVSLTLTLLDNHIRTSSDPSPQYARGTGADNRFVDDLGGVSAIVTSTAQSDTGLFELRLDDDRYLPFEGAGAVSTWKLRLNAVYPQFNPDSMSDVVLQLHYTARDGGETLATAARDEVRARLNAVALEASRRGLYRLISAVQEDDSKWYEFLHPATGQDQVLRMETPPDRFPFFTSGFDLKVTGIDVIAQLDDPGDYTLVITRPGAPAQTVTMSVEAALGGRHHFGAHPLTPNSPLGRAPAKPPLPTWTFKLQKAGASDFRSLQPDEIDSLIVILQYQVTP